MQHDGAFGHTPRCPNPPHNHSYRVEGSIQVESDASADSAADSGKQRCAANATALPPQRELAKGVRAPPAP